MTDEDSKGRNSRRKRRDRKERNYLISSEDLLENRSLARRSRSSSDVDSSLKTPKCERSASSSPSRSRSSKFKRQERHARCIDEHLEVVYPVSHRFKMAVDYRTYRLADTSRKYVQPVSNYIAKMAKQMAAQI